MIDLRLKCHKALVAQLVRALVLWANGRGFDPHLEHFLNFNKICNNIIWFLWKNAKKIILYNWSSNFHHSDKLFIVNLSITIYVGLTYHLINFFLGYFFSKVCHRFLEFRSWDITISILVKYIKNFHKPIGVFDFSRNKFKCTSPSRKETMKNQSHHFDQYQIYWSYLGVPLKWDFDLKISWQSLIPKLFNQMYIGCDRPITILVKQSKSVLKFSNLFFVQLASHTQKV